MNQTQADEANNMSIKTDDIATYLEENDWHQVTFGLWVHKNTDEETYTLEQAYDSQLKWEAK